MVSYLSSLTVNGQQIWNFPTTWIIRKQNLKATGLWIGKKFPELFGFSNIVHSLPPVCIFFFVTRSRKIGIVKYVLSTLILTQNPNRNHGLNLNPSPVHRRSARWGVFTGPGLRYCIYIPMYVFAQWSVCMLCNKQCSLSLSLSLPTLWLGLNTNVIRKRNYTKCPATNAKDAARSTGFSSNSEMMVCCRSKAENAEKV